MDSRHWTFKANSFDPEFLRHIRECPECGKKAKDYLEKSLATYREALINLVSKFEHPDDIGPMPEDFVSDLRIDLGLYPDVKDFITHI